MKKLEGLQNENHGVCITDPLLNSVTGVVRPKAGRKLRNVLYLTGLVGIGIFFNSCMAGYVANEPAYIEVNRPMRPSQTHIWVSGNWSWNNQTHGYVQRAGYWERPRVNHTYVEGRWQSAPQGKYWERGRWQKQNNKKNRVR